MVTSLTPSACPPAVADLPPRCAFSSRACRPPCRGRQTFPTRRRRGAIRGPGTSSQEGGLMTQTILLLDDNTQLRNVVRRLLEGAGYLVVAAATAVEAFEFAAAPGARID